MGGAKQRQKDKQKRMAKQKSASSVPGLATDKTPGTIAGVEEDHRFEQFFYDDATSQRLFKLVQRFERPLLLCNPTLAVLAEKAGLDYLLLDRDRRFKFLSHYQQFFLLEPFLVTFPFDAIFVDPPFSNVTPQQLRRCVDLMSGTESQRAAPIFVAHKADREEALVEAFEGRGSKLHRKWRLGYQSGVSDRTQEQIFLFGPSDVPA